MGENQPSTICVYHYEYTRKTMSSKYYSSNTVDRTPYTHLRLIMVWVFTVFKKYFIYKANKNIVEKCFFVLRFFVLSLLELSIPGQETFMTVAL